MTKLKRAFVDGIMDKTTNPKLLNNGKYIDALNIQVGDVEEGGTGVIINARGNRALTNLNWDGNDLSADAECIGFHKEEARNLIIWAIHDPSFVSSNTGKLDMVLSFDVRNNVLTYIAVSMDDGGGVDTTLNFSPEHRFNGITLVDQMINMVDNNSEPYRFYLDKSYATPDGSGIDGITKAEILAIKSPPLAAPTTTPLYLGDGEDFMKDRFLSFAYRYKYHSGEYSATSQWSKSVFITSVFDYNEETFLNEGMLNLANAVDVGYNSGNSLVESVEILFKEHESSVIRVVKEIDKSKDGLADDTDYSFQFKENKVQRVLTEDEILRTHDDVPLKAKAVAAIGGRIVYGNYTKGRDLKDENNNDVHVDYSTELVSTQINVDNLESEDFAVNYTWNSIGFIPSTGLQIDFDGVALDKGSWIQIELQLNHYGFVTSPSFTPGPEENDQIYIVLSYLLTQTYTSAYDLVQDPLFQAKVGSAVDASNFAGACVGNTWTHSFNCAMQTSLNGLDREAIGITAADEPISVTSPSLGSSLMYISIPLTKYVDVLGSPTQSAWEIMEINSFSALLRNTSDTSSLHSSRGYEVGLEYLDDQNRPTTSLMSDNNTLSLSAGTSETKNQIQVTIPSKQLPPEWASRFRFTVRADKENYETIFTNTFFRDTDTNDVWFLLEGEQSRKVEEGDVLVVKRDTQGPVSTYIEATVLDKGAKEPGFITDQDGAYVPTGVYMRLNPNGFSIETLDKRAFISRKQELTCATDNGTYPVGAVQINFQNDDNGNASYPDIEIPAGSTITFNFQIGRRGTGAGGTGSCKRRDYILKKKFTSTRDYASFVDWFEGDNIENFLDDGTKQLGDANSDIYFSYNSSMLVSTTALNLQAVLAPTIETIKFRFYHLKNQTYSGSAVGPMYLTMTGTRSCGSNGGKKSCISATINIQRASDAVVFETKPSDSLPEIMYVGSQVFDIEGGYHKGTEADQDATTDAVILLDVANCFSFGNGVESYKIQDSVVGKRYGFGQWVSVESIEGYKEKTYKNDLKYSGIYNDESNVNKTNNFNLGLSNYKHLEDSFGAIQYLDVVLNDLRVFQTDKISYVLAGKNILNDTSGESLLTSVPEVFGTQLPRIEDYGVGDNPESIARWGAYTFFTDNKRSASLMMQGSGRQEGLSVISEAFMTEWHYERFKESRGKQILGGIDPRTKEYLISFTDKDLLEEVDYISCGVSKTINMEANSTYTYYVLTSNNVGDMTFAYKVNGVLSDGFSVDVDYNGSITGSGSQVASGNFDVNKNSTNVNILEVTVTMGDEASEITITSSCPDSDRLTVVEITMHDGVINQRTTNGLEWVLGGEGSALVQKNITLPNSPSNDEVIAQFLSQTGSSGDSIFPIAGSTVKMSNFKTATDDFDLDDSTHRFRYLKSATEYGTGDIATIVAASTEIVPTAVLGVNSKWEGEFVMPEDIGEYLYLIYDYR